MTARGVLLILMLLGWTGSASAAVTVTNAANPNTSEFKNALYYGATVDAGVTAIQAAEQSANTIGAALPLQIYIPAGTHTLSAPITITRHNVILIVDGGAKLIPADNTAAIVFDGTATSEGYMKHWGLFMHGSIWGNTTGTGQHGVVLKNTIHGSLIANEIRSLGGDGIRFDGSTFSNTIQFNRIVACAGWGINSTNTVSHGTPDHNTNILIGEVQDCGSGAANFKRWNESDITLRVENFGVSYTGNIDTVIFDSARGNVFHGYFENPSNLDGDDIKTLATDYSTSDLTIDAPMIFWNVKNSGSYNIRLSDSTVQRFNLRGGRVWFFEDRLLYVGSGNSAITIYPDVAVNPTSVTNNAGTQLKYVTSAP